MGEKATAAEPSATASILAHMHPSAFADRFVDGMRNSRAKRTPVEECTFSQVVLSAALFLKGGLFGAYHPFFSLWLHDAGYDDHIVGTVIMVDTMSSILLVPFVGALLDKFRVHNIGICVILLLLAVLKLAHLPVKHQLVYLCLLAALTAPLLRAANSVADALVLYGHKRKSDFPRTRLFGSLGYGVLSFGTGFLVADSLDVLFYVFALLCLVASAYWFVAHRLVGAIPNDFDNVDVVAMAAEPGVSAERPQTHVKRHRDPQADGGQAGDAEAALLVGDDCTAADVGTKGHGCQYGTVSSASTESVVHESQTSYRDQLGLAYQACDASTGRVALVLLLLGMCAGVIASFEFVMLERMGADRSFMGLCRLVGVVLEAPLWLASGALFERFGVFNMQTVAMIGNAIRLYWYGLIRQPHEALYCEVFHGCTFALPYSAICCYSGARFPEQTKALVLSMCIVVMSGLGAGVGALAGGYVASCYGDLARMFRTFGAIMLVAGVSCASYDGFRGLWRYSTTPRS